MYKRYQTAQTNPDLAKVLDGVSVVPAGDRLKVEAPVSEDQLGALITQQSFCGSDVIHAKRLIWESRRSMGW